MMRLGAQTAGLGVAISLLALISVLVNERDSGSWVMSVLSLGLGVLMTIAGASVALISRQFSQRGRCEEIS